MLSSEEVVCDVAGRALEVGDTVVTVNGQTTGRVCEIAYEEDDLGFVAIRPVHHSYAKGVWYAADQVFWVARSNDAKSAPDASAKASKSNTNGAQNGSKVSPATPGAARTERARKK
ncbi:hypothetical protein [Algisphaera agarilytica]|uniref:Uncharacterized protein n=1 Tax=Algisphaera agarilytica TaxID=1385975 RepID=A0A7X0H6A1_9BACT|nr:hypothetical protein [Algisphaera agarilytica]MBB6428590.1 hypothetical protein [Algisphaera agarilytica]